MSLELQNKLRSRIIEACLHFLFYFLDFTERSIKKSKFVYMVYRTCEKLYPEKLFSFFDGFELEKKSRIFANIFAPEILILAYLIYISLSSYRISNLSLFVVFSSFIFFEGGRKLGIRKSEIKLNENMKKITLLLFLISLIFLFLDLNYAKAIPLFTPSLRRNLNVFYTSLAFLLPPACIFFIAYAGKNFEKKEARIYSSAVFILSLFLISLLGFRTQIMVLILGSIIAARLSRLINAFEVFFGLILAILALIFFSYLRASSEGSAFFLFNTISSRIGITLGIFDFVVHRFFPFGASRGYATLAIFSSFIPGFPGPKLGPRTFLANMLFGIRGISMTSTLLGLPFLDFGIFGAWLCMLLLGYILSSAYNLAKSGKELATGVYSLLLAYAIAGIETGIADFIVVVFFTASYLALRR